MYDLSCNCNFRLRFTKITKVIPNLGENAFFLLGFAATAMLDFASVDSLRLATTRLVIVGGTVMMALAVVFRSHQKTDKNTQNKKDRAGK